MAEPFTDRALPAARAALAEWGSAAEAVIATAIAGAETNWTDEPGDPLDSFDEEHRPAYEPFACDGFTSWGQWQCNYRWNKSTIDQVANVSDPCAARDWLLDVNNCAKAAHEIYTRQLWAAWSTFNAGRHIAYLDEANWAVNQVTPQLETPATSNQDDLVNLLGYLQGDVANAIDQAIQDLCNSHTIPGEDPAIQAADAALNTLRTAGKPQQ